MVIAILVAISIVSYIGIQNSANEAALKSDLRNASTQLEVERSGGYGSYPNKGSGGGDLPGSDGTSYQYSNLDDGAAFCLTATRGTTTQHITNGGAPQEGVCAGHVAPSGGSGSNTIVRNSPIQDVTSGQCTALPVFTGSNTDAVRTVTDTRGGTTRTYEIAKLADNNCWMLNNLKLGGSTSITLTSADSDVASSFTLPALTNGGSINLDNPRAYGPVPGDTGSGATNYGYLYNWPAATGGESRSTAPAGSQAPHSICPAGWRLPTGDNGGEFNALNIAFGYGGTGTIVYDGPSVSAWQSNGAFRGSFSGFRGSSSFNNQGSGGSLWSSSTRLSDVEDALHASFDFDPSRVLTTAATTRGYGYGVRCLLN